MRLLKKISDGIASYKLSCVLFLLLMLLTYLGTMYQVRHGLYLSQQKYFESLFLVHWAYGVFPLPLPGGYLVLMAAFVNLSWGVVVRFRLKWEKVGVAAVHAGMLLLLLGAFIAYLYAVNGHMVLFEGQASNEMENPYRWEVGISEARTDVAVTEHLIGQHEFEHLTGDRRQRFTFAGLPFEMEMRGYLTNAVPASISEDVAAMNLLPRPLESEMQRNQAGLCVALIDPADGSRTERALWGGAEHIEPITAAGKRWNIVLRRQRVALPFTVRLDKFTRKMHPRTNTPAEFVSEITKLDDSVSQSYRISMNEPFRYAGYTLYQSSWGSQDTGRGEQVYSVFSVVKNPADKVPLYACLITTAGLLLHFSRKLVLYLRRQRVTAVVVLGSVLCLVFSEGPASAQTAPPDWDQETVRSFSRVPVQDGGRVKPLDTYASFAMLQMHGRRSLRDQAGRRLLPAAWLLDCLFFPHAASAYPLFRVENADVMLSIGVEPKKKRDNYSYLQLLPARQQLLEKAQELSDREARLRTATEKELLALAFNVRLFEDLVSSGDLLREQFDLSESERLSALFAPEKACRMSGLLRRGPEILEMFRELHQRQADAPEEYRAVTAVLQHAEEVVGHAAALALFPPRDGDESGHWFTFNELLEPAVGGEPLDAQIEMLALLEKAADAAADPAALRAAIQAFSAASIRQAQVRGEYDKIPLEVAFYRLSPFYYALVLYILAFLAAACLWMRPQSRLLWGGTMAVTTLPTLLLLAGITMRCIIRGRPPVTSVYETILFVTAVAVMIALFLEWANRQGMAVSLGALLGAAGMFFAQKYEAGMGADTMPALAAVLNTNFWLAAHVTTIAIGYGAGFLASALAHVFILGSVTGLRRNDTHFYSELTRMVYGSTCFSFVFICLGTVLGGIWANESWGRFWGWDPKENGALLICLWQLTILHARLDGMLKRHGIHIATVTGGIIIAFCWFGVNMLGVGLHSYGFTSGGYAALFYFYVFQAAVAALGVAAWYRDRGTIPADT